MSVPSPVKVDFESLALAFERTREIYDDLQKSSDKQYVYEFLARIGGRTLGIKLPLDDAL